MNRLAYHHLDRCFEFHPTRQGIQHRQPGLDLQLLLDGAYPAGSPVGNLKIRILTPGK